MSKPMIFQTVRTLKISKYVHILIHGKNNFAEIFKNLARYRSENNFLSK